MRLPCKWPISGNTYPCYNSTAAACIITQGQVIIDHPEAVQTLQAYVDVFNHHNIAWPIRDLPSLWAAIKLDEVLSFLAADWFVGFLRNNVPEHAGKWRAMPLPAWRAGGLGGSRPSGEAPPSS